MTPAARFTALAAIIIAVGAGCSSCENGAESPSPPESQARDGDRGDSRSPPAPGEAGSATRARVDLADEPDVDLVANRFLWHLSSAGSGSADAGLLIPLASEGLRKYTQEYSQPWGDMTAVEGTSGRALAARSATLRFPWHDSGPATLRLRVHGAVAGQRLSVSVNGKSAGNSTLEPSWQTVDLTLDVGALARGENEAVLFLKKRGGPARSYGLFHSMELVPGAGAQAPQGGPDSWPGLSPARAVDIAGERKASLAGFSRMSMYVEVPATGWLELFTGAAGAPAQFRVTARTVDGKARTVLEHAGKAGAWTRHQVSLAPFADRLIELTLTVAGPGAAAAAWGAPRIALEKAALRARPGPYRNAILVVVDALRSDRLALYGKTRVRTPRITADGKARGVTFLYNQAASPSSPPSHGSIQTGMIPRVHGVTGDRGRLEPGTPMLSTQLGAAGVATAYYGNNPFGMARLEKPGRWTEFHQTNQEGKGIDCTVLMAEMLSFAKKQAGAGRRFFVSSLPYETHTPYRYHQGISERYYSGEWRPPVGKSVGGDLLGRLSSGAVKLDKTQWAQLYALYDGEAEYMDGCYGQLLDGLAALGIADDTLVVLTSDHGEGMFEHGRMGHAYGHYAELGNVPLVLLGKGLVDSGIAVATVTSHLDIVPTILDLMGVTASERVQGHSLVPLAMRRGPWTPRVMPLEYGRSYALRAARWKYIVDYQGQESVFDLATDPTEQNELEDERPMALRYLRDLAGFFLAHRSDWRMSTWGALNNHGAGLLRHVGEPVAPR